MPSSALIAKDPRPHLLVGLVVASVVWTMLVYVVQPRYNIDTAPLTSLIGYVIGFFFTAFVGLYIYFFTTAQSQDREWRQQYTMKHVDSIYVPLYDEIIQTIGTLGDTKITYLQEWPKIKKTHFRFFVDDELARLLDELETFLSSSLGRTWSRGYDTTSGAAVDVLRAKYGDRVPEGQYTSMKNYVASDATFIYDSATRLPSKYAREGVRGAAGNLEGTPLTDAQLDSIFGEIKDAIEKVPETALYRQERDQAIAMASALEKELKDRILRPYAVL